jgi:hypothetical protein
MATVVPNFRRRRGYALHTHFAYLLHHHSEELPVLLRDDGLNLSAKHQHAEGGK